MAGIYNRAGGHLGLADVPPRPDARGEFFVLSQRAYVARSLGVSRMRY